MTATTRGRRRVVLGDIASAAHVLIDADVDLDEREDLRHVHLEV